MSSNVVCGASAPGQRDDRVVTFTFADTLPDELTPVANWSVRVERLQAPRVPCSAVLAKPGLARSVAIHWDGLTPEASRRDRAFWQERGRLPAPIATQPSTVASAAAMPAATTMPGEAAMATFAAMPGES